jgi:hypothetical protein
VDVTLQLATTSSSVNVEETAVAVDTSSSTISGDVSPTEVKKLPLNGRNYLQLAMMVPGITSNDVTNSPLGATDSGKLQINVDGQQVTQNAGAMPSASRSTARTQSTSSKSSRTVLTPRSEGRRVCR